MKRAVSILSVLSLALVMTVAAFGQTPAKPQHLSKQQLNTLIATAKTPAEHQRIAQFYQSQAQDYLAQADEHAAMVAAYKSNLSLTNNKNQASTISHCEYFVQTFKDLAVKSQELATMHEQMAKEADKK
ncbi:MAG TPA: hypothetical protein VF865_02700 [Acidobacteriaceae bacterium]